ncbi:MAG: hypothetical protein ABI216_21935 [Devosia sp.]
MNTWLLILILTQPASAGFVGLTVNTGVTMQQFSSKDLCESAVKLIDSEGSVYGKYFRVVSHKCYENVGGNWK